MNKRIFLMGLTIVLSALLFVRCTHIPIRLISSLTKEEEIQLDVTSFSIDTSGYDITSNPIGIGEYSVEKNMYADNMAELYLKVKKNTNMPWCGAINIVWELFDVNGNSIGKKTGRCGEMLAGYVDNVAVIFDINDSGKIIYNQIEISKVKLISLSEEDDLHSFLVSNFINKKNMLKKYLDEENLEMFYAEIENVRAEYNRDEFPNENRELDELEVQANNLRQASEAETVKSIPEESQTQTESINEPKMEYYEESKNSPEMIKYKKYGNDSVLTKGERIFVSGKINAAAISENMEDGNMTMLINDKWYIIYINNIGFYYRDMIIEEGGFGEGSYIGLAAEFDSYWTDDSGELFTVVNGRWFTPPHFIEGESDYVELPVYNGKDIYTWD